MIVRFFGGASTVLLYPSRSSLRFAAIKKSNFKKGLKNIQKREKQLIKLRLALKKTSQAA
jgi:hypothetical protein